MSLGFRYTYKNKSLILNTELDVNNKIHISHKTNSLILTIDNLLLSYLLHTIFFQILYVNLGYHIRMVEKYFLFSLKLIAYLVANSKNSIHVLLSCSNRATLGTGYSPRMQRINIEVTKLIIDRNSMITLCCYPFCNLSYERHLNINDWSIFQSLNPIILIRYNSQTNLCNYTSIFNF